MKRKMTAVLIGMMLLLTACGNKDAKDVSEYGTESSTTGTEQAGGGATTASGSTEAGTVAPKANTGSSLLAQLGGENLKFQSDFQIGTKKAKIDTECNVTDSPTLESYRLHAITEDRIYEAEVVKALFGDSAQEVRRKVGTKHGDSDNVVSMCTDFAMFSGDGDGFDEEEVPEEVPGWVDEDDYYLHTYEGKWNGVDSQLTVSYTKDEQQKGFAFGPKNWGDAIGKPELEGVTVVGDSEYYVIDPESGEYVDKDASKLKDKENHASMNIEDAVAKAKSFFSDTMKLKLTSDGIIPSSKNADGSAEYEGDNLMFYPKSAIKDESMTGAVINGYAMVINSQISNQECHLSEFSDDVIRYNYGNIWFADKEVAGFYILISLDYDECLSDQVAILSFENAMKVVQQGLEKQFDSSKATGDTVEFRDAQLVYYPVQSPKDPAEFTYVPAWLLYAYTNNAYMMGEVLANATDGSILAINYGEGEDEEFDSEDAEEIDAESEEIVDEDEGLEDDGTDPEEGDVEGEPEEDAPEDEEE